MRSRYQKLDRYLEFNGLRMSVTEWAERLEVPRHALYRRLARKWTIKRTLSTPVRAYLPTAATTI